MNKELSGLLEKLKKDKDVLAVSVFGSFARGEKHRDIDVCVFLKPGKRRSIEISEKRLAYITKASDKLDIQIFQQMPLPIKHRILKEGKLIFCADEDKFFDMAYLTAKEFEDFKPIYKSYLEGVKHA